MKQGCVDSFDVRLGSTVRHACTSCTRGYLQSGPGPLNRMKAIERSHHAAQYAEAGEDRVCDESFVQSIYECDELIPFDTRSRKIWHIRALEGTEVGTPEAFGDFLSQSEPIYVHVRGHLRGITAGSRRAWDSESSLAFPSGSPMVGVSVSTGFSLPLLCSGSLMLCWSCNNKCWTAGVTWLTSAKTVIAVYGGGASDIFGNHHRDSS